MSIPIIPQIVVHVASGLQKTVPVLYGQISTIISSQHVNIHAETDQFVSIQHHYVAYQKALKRKYGGMVMIGLGVLGFVILFVSAPPTQDVIEILGIAGSFFSMLCGCIIGGDASATMELFGKLRTQCVHNHFYIKDDKTIVIYDSTDQQWIFHRFASKEEAECWGVSKGKDFISAVSSPTTKAKSMHKLLWKI